MNIKYLLVFCLGAVTGSVFAARFLDERYSKIADEEIESVKQVAKKTIDELKDQISESKKIPAEKIDKTMYHDIAHEYSPEELPQIDILTDEEYSTGENEKITVWFYGQDGALLDDSEQPIENISDCIGKDIIETPEKYFSDSKNTIYIRNHSMGIDFEVIYLNKSYSKDVLGLEE